MADQTIEKTDIKNLEPVFRELMEKPRSDNGMGAKFEKFPLTLPSLPEKIDLSKFQSEQDREDIEKIEKGLRYFIFAPIIEDEFKESEETDRKMRRSEIAANIKEKYGEEAHNTFNEFANYNKLKKNTSTKLEYASSIYLSFFDAESKTAAKMQEILKHDYDVEYGEPDEQGQRKVIKDVWNEKTLSEKKSTLLQLTSLAADMLWEIANK